MNSIEDKIKKIGIIPVVSIDNENDAVPMANALKAGELPYAEITFRTDAAYGAMKKISDEVSDFIFGAGTVVSTEQVDMALNAGARFIVMPGMDEKIVNYCIKKDVLVIPGCSTASDMQRASAMGLHIVKFFPAEQAGGIGYLKALSGPYYKLHFMPTGGINIDNLKNYLSWDRVAACGGTWIAPNRLISEGKFGIISENAKKAVQAVLGFELKHIGINCADAETAVSGAKQMENIFGFSVKEGESNCFSGSYMEFLKTPYLGKKGHIAIGTNSIERAVAYLKSKQVDIDESTKVILNDGKLTAVYLKEEICGFAVHLLQK